MAEAIVKWAEDNHAMREKSCPNLQMALAEAMHRPGARVVSEGTEYWYEADGRLRYRHLKWWERES